MIDPDEPGNEDTENQEPSDSTTPDPQKPPEPTKPQEPTKPKPEPKPKPKPKPKEEEPDEENVLVDFASLTAAELEKSFGSYKPVNSINPYMIKVIVLSFIEVNYS